MQMMQTENIGIVIGFIVWLLFGILSFPHSTFSLNYVQVLILAAPLWLIPLTWQMLDTPDWLTYISTPASILLALSFLFSLSVLIALLTIPWLIMTVALALQKLNDWRVAKSRSIHHLCQLFAYLFLPIGAAWAFVDRLGFQPLGFDSTIVLLTVAHFHYAGFLLPTIAALVVKNIMSSWNTFIGWAVILGIPLVAIGITTTHFDLPIWIEVMAVTIMFIGGFGIGLLYCFWGGKHWRTVYGKLWIVGGIALLAGMSLALGYGWRHYYLIPTLTIPWMYVVHGTLNAVGFALPTILGWKFYWRSKRI